MGMPTRATFGIDIVRAKSPCSIGPLHAVNEPFFDKRIENAIKRDAIERIIEQTEDFGMRHRLIVFFDEL